MAGRLPAHSAGFQTAGPYLTDSDGGRAMFLDAPMAPGESTASCISITNQSTVAADVRMFGSTQGTGLDRYLRLTVVRGHGTRALEGSCRGFRPDARGVVFEGSLRAFPDAFANGMRDARVAWVPGESHAYRFLLRLRGVNAAQGLTARQSILWEARVP
jgi:hypothetical protein